VTGARVLSKSAFLPPTSTHAHGHTQGDLGKGAFQELDQVAALEPFCKYAASIPRSVALSAVAHTACL